MIVTVIVTVTIMVIVMVMVTVTMMVTVIVTVTMMVAVIVTVTMMVTVIVTVTMMVTVIVTLIVTVTVTHTRMYRHMRKTVSMRSIYIQTQKVTCTPKMSRGHITVKKTIITFKGCKLLGK